ncbi:MAG TPA: hypothetical protein VK014_06315 [Cyclobacteriaceae bacterium]|nr:hypothetical protein [Cyclobacteriaceae bacterium]
MPYEEGGRRLARLFFDYPGLADEFVGIIQWDSDNQDTLVHQFNQAGKEKHLVRILS